MASTSSIRIGIVDDQRIFLEGMEALLGDESSVNIVFTAIDGPSCLRALDKDLIDVLLLDLSMPVMDGLETTKRALAKHPKLRILILTTSNDAQDVIRMRQAGVKGYLLKNTDRKELLQAIGNVFQGETYYSDEAARAVIDEVVKPDTKDSDRFTKVVALTKREQEILCLIANESTTQDIAGKLFLSPHTVESHRKNLLSKVGAKNTAGLVHYAVKHGFCE